MIPSPPFTILRSRPVPGSLIWPPLGNASRYSHRPSTMRRGTLPRPSALRGQGARPPASRDSLRTPPCAHWPSVRSLSSPNQDRFDLYSFSVFSQSVFSLSTSYYYSYSHSLLYLQPHPAGFGPHSDPVLSSCVIGIPLSLVVCCLLLLQQTLRFSPLFSDGLSSYP